ncbi:MAG: hypothetical protein DDT38_00128 [Firmicutes bacterium]|nr:hypothetical protein [candidate division NPL-UPA2 bacterium]
MCLLHQLCHTGGVTGRLQQIFLAYIQIDDQNLYRVIVAPYIKSCCYLSQQVLFQDFQREWVAHRAVKAFSVSQFLFAIHSFPAGEQLNKQFLLGVGKLHRIRISR